MIDRKLRPLALALSLTVSAAACVEQAPVPPTTLPRPQTELIPTPVPEREVVEKPNIVILMLDDIPPHDGRLFDKELMPDIYKIFIERGIRFENFYGETPLCCPGRVGFITGEHTQNHGVVDNINTPRDFDFSDTLITRLKDAGYYTIWTGKSLNGFQGFVDKTIDGLDKQAVFNENNGQFFDYDLIDLGGLSVHFGNNPEEYSTDVIAQKTMQYIQEAPPNQPIFAIISPYAGHFPNTPSPKYASDSRCNALPNWNPPNFNEADISDKPEFFQGLPRLENDGFVLSKICKALRSVNDLVWYVNNELERQGRAENTIFILTSDNGSGWGAHRWRGKTVPFTTQIPLYITWEKGRGNSPRIEEATFSNIDLAPTLCKLAGCTMPNSDGITFDPLLRDQEFKQEREVILESVPQPVTDEDGREKIPAWSSARTTELSSLGRWRYTEYPETGEVELYSVSNGPCYEWKRGMSGDPCELTNRADDKSLELVRNELSNMLLVLKQE